MNLSRNFLPITKEEEDAYLEDKEFALLNGYTEWEKSIPSYTFFLALAVFPEAKPQVIKEMKEELAEARQRLSTIEDFYDKLKTHILETEKSYHNAIQLIQVLTDYAEQECAEPREKIKRIQFNLNILQKSSTHIEEWTQKIAKAKAVPITDLLSFQHNKTKCIWHNTDKTPSLHYYPKQNKAYCFGLCGKGYDSIDVAMQLDGISFKEAVKKLCEQF